MVAVVIRLSLFVEVGVEVTSASNISFLIIIFIIVYMIYLKVVVMRHID
jgi:hypothetical protein